MVRLLAATRQTRTTTSSNHPLGDTTMVDEVVGLYRFKLVVLSYQLARSPFAQQFPRRCVSCEAVLDSKQSSQS